MKLQISYLRYYTLSRIITFHYSVNSCYELNLGFSFIDNCITLYESYIMYSLRIPFYLLIEATKVFFVIVIYRNLKCIYV